MITSIRFGYTPSIHLLPLIHPLLAGWVYPTGLRLDLVALSPDQIEQDLDEGRLDGALIGPGGFARRRRALEVMPGIGLAATGANALAVLLSDRRPDELDGASIAPDEAAAASPAVQLLRVLAANHFGIGLNLAGEPSAAGGPRLLVGDAAVVARAPWLTYEARFSPAALAAEERAAKGRQTDGPVTGEAAPPPDPAQLGWAEDLGGAWWVLTGTPLVWALGVMRRELLDSSPDAVVAVVRAFQSSRQAAREQEATILDTAARQAGVNQAIVQLLFARQTVELGSAEQGGLSAFLAQTGKLPL